MANNPEVQQGLKQAAMQNGAVQPPPEDSEFVDATYGDVGSVESAEIEQKKKPEIEGQESGALLSTDDAIISNSTNGMLLNIDGYSSGDLSEGEVTS